MKNQTTTNPSATPEKTIVAPALTRALRSAIRSQNVEDLLRTAGATKFRGTPIETLEEVAAIQTANWLSNPMAANVATAGIHGFDAKLLSAATECIDEESLINAVELIGIHGTSEIDAAKTQLTFNLGQIALEAYRFADAEDRPVDHNCIAVGASNWSRTSASRAFVPTGQTDAR